MEHTYQQSDASKEIKDSERLQTLYVVNDMLKQVEADGLNINLILPRVLNLAVKQLEAEDGSIIVINEEMEVEHAWLTVDNVNEDKNSKFLGNIMNVGVGGWVIRSQQPIVIDDTQTDERWLPRPGHTTTKSSWSVICTPLIVRDRAIGAITIHKPGIGAFDDHDLSLLTAISNQAASSIENARLFEASKRQLKISALLNEASRVINSSLDIDEIMQSLLAQMNEFLNAEAISIALVDKQTNELVYQVAEGIGENKIVGLRLPSNHGLSGWVMEHSEPALVTNTSRDSRFHNLGDQRTGHPTRAMICAPMQFKGEVLGTIQAINPNEGTFTHEDLDLLVNLANIASTAIANAQQYARTQAAEARYTSLFQDTIDPIILTDLDGRIIEANRRAIEFFGCDRPQLLSKRIHDLHAPSFRLPTASSIRRNKVTLFESKAIANDGNIPVEVYAKRTLYGNNEVLQWIYHDISKQVELEKMREDLTAMLFHDLQSPLGNVISSLELLAYEIPPMAEDSPLLSMLDIAKRSSQRLQTLIRSLLDINRLEAGQPISEQIRVDIYNLIDEVWEIERPNFEQRRIQFAHELEPDLPHLYVEEDMVRRVLINLLGNALKYSSEDQTITVSAQLYYEDEEMVLISVSDQGMGIPVKYRKSIFEKFERVKTDDPNSKGLGLGLAFCRLAIEAHDGRIWVDDAPSGGARFNFTLPLAADGVPISLA